MTTTSSAVASGAATGKLALQVQPPDAQEFVQESPTPLIPGSFDDSFPSSASSTGQEFANSINNSGTTDGAPNRKAAGMSRSLRISVSPITSTDYRTSAPISPGSILDLYTRSPTSDARCSASLSASPGQPTVTSSSGESLRQGHQSSESTPMPPPADASESAQRDQKMSVPIGQVVVDACADGNQATVPALAPASGPTRSDIWPSYADNGVRACKTSDSSAAAGGAGLMTGTGSWPLAGAVNAGAGKSSSRRPNYVQGSPSIRAHPMMNTNNSNTHATGGGGSCGSPQAPFGFTQPPLPSPRSRSSTNNFGSGVAAPVSHSLNEQDSATSAQSEDASASFAARAGATSLTEAGSSSSTVNVASDIKNVATTSKTTSSPSKRDDGIVDPASLSIAAVQQLPELGIAHPQKRPASGSDIYPVSEDSAHAMWSQYQDQFELTDGNNDIDDPKRAAAKPSTIRSLTLGSAAADSSEQHKISQRSCMLAEVYDPFSTTTAPGTTAPVAPAGSPSYYEIPAVYQAKAITDINAPAPPASTSDSAAEGTDKETDGASDAFSASQEAPHIPHRVSSSFQGGVPPAATRTADASTSVVDPPSSTAAHHVPLKAASPLAQAIPFEDVYMDAGSVIIPSRSDSGGSDDLGHLDPKMGGVDPAMLESSVAISASNTASALTTTLTSAPSAAPRATTAVRLEQGQERTSGGIDASDSSDYGSDAHEETLQRPPRRNRLREGSDNQLPVGPQRPSSTLITTAVGDYLEDKMEISAPSEFSSAPSDGDLTAEQQAQLEARLEKEADEMDPSRPRTLQEARALARERARLRQQQAALPEGTPEVVAAVSPQMRPKRDPRRGTAESQVVNSTSMLHHSSEMPIQNSRAVLEGSSQPGSGGLTLDSIPSRSAENGALSTSLRDKRKGQVSPVLPQKQTVSPISGIKDLQAAVSASMNDISFGSTVEAVSQGCAAPQTQHSPTASRGVLTPRQSSLAQLPQTSSSQPSFSGNTHSNSVTPRIEHVPAFDFRLGPMGGPSLAVDSHFAEQPVYPTPLVTVGRIEIYGKTLPWPAAFDSSKIIEKKRNAAWDRAKLYAIATNQLLTTPTNLATWVEVKNRPTAKLVPTRTDGKHAKKHHMQLPSVRT
ncbi:hypothetical protein K437DRAFT_264151 [Tilletiaria anomala UBC 951]|uniref:Uncharacterized protein n=1 Tax=Tilletiaria anomala (strain ATCC 24038 / CBS 436.72 / UBC 951) TaxID=1037660 RepID=A0A066VQW2_TILAU|nr:uncharacterized protein K437DRAFT_264151 [Tilletiaria anomala UBC 951]KDN40955.1 hypothetical protein K437DRAFT_264151 [Tilletiaria anomala UBC 951]